MEEISESDIIVHVRRRRDGMIWVYVYGLYPGDDGDFFMNRADLIKRQNVICGDQDRVALQFEWSPFEGEEVWHPITIHVDDSDDDSDIAEAMRRTIYAGLR